MSRIVYVNGRYLSYKEAGLPIEDRAILFGDAVYEVCQIKASSIIDLPRHLDRLWRSMGEVAIELAMTRASLEHIISLTCRKNRVSNGMVYLQVTRGEARRDFVFPSKDIVPSLICFARNIPLVKSMNAQNKGIHVITTRDLRWGRVDIKTTNLLASVLARETAKSLKAQEAWLTNAKGVITEGAASNAWILSSDGNLYTHPSNGNILKGITKDVLMDVCKDQNINVKEIGFTIKQALEAKEAFVTAATNILTPVVQINGKIIGNGKAGSLTKKLRIAFQKSTHKIKI